MNTLQSLIDRARDAYERAGGLRYEPSFPILYFGDYEAYRKSPLRIITVGLNPGPPAFDNERNKEFVDAYIKGKSYLDAWNNWFDREEDQWFINLDRVVSGFGASFYRRDKDKKSQTVRNTALHTDLLSPVATKPPWSKLPSAAKNALGEPGVPLWLALAAFLEPHLVLISVARKHLTRLGLDWHTLPKTFTAKKNGDPRTPYVLQHAVTQFSPGQDTDVVFGPGAQVPFGTLSNDQKSGIAEFVKGQLTHW